MHNQGTKILENYMKNEHGIKPWRRNLMVQ